MIFSAIFPAGLCFLSLLSSVPCAWQLRVSLSPLLNSITCFCAFTCFTSFTASIAFLWIMGKSSLHSSPLGTFVIPSISSEVLLSLSFSPCPQNHHHHHLLYEMKWYWKCCLCLAPGCSWVISLPLGPSMCSDLVTATPLPTVIPFQDALELLERIFRTTQIRYMSKSWWCCSFISWS